MPITPAMKCAVVVSISLLLGGEAATLFAWSNRGHRTVNLVAAESFPESMPQFIRSPAAIRGISYLGPEPDRWRPEIAPELGSTSAPDHAFRVELAEQLGSMPRTRYEFLHDLEIFPTQHPDVALTMSAQRIGTLPWQALEVFERLVSAFHSYRIVTGEYPGSAYADMAPMTKEDRPNVEESILFYSGWLGHYIGDVSMPLHDTVNLAGWVEKENPHNYTTKGEIHHRLEVVVDAAIETGKVNPKTIEKQMTAPKHLEDPFADILKFTKAENAHQEEVYQIDQRGGIIGSGSPELNRFVEARMAEGGSMLRDMIYTAWLDSAALSTTKHNGRVTLAQPKTSEIR